MKGGARVVVEPHRHEGIFIARGKEDALVTKNMVVGESVYGEKRISVDGEDGTKTEYRVWNPFRSKVAAGILGGLDNIYIKPGTKLLYLGAAAGTTVSHCSDVVGPEGLVYAVEFSHRPGRDLVNMAKKRTNIIPIIEDARHPIRYRMLVGMVRHHSFYTSFVAGWLFRTKLLPRLFLLFLFLLFLLFGKSGAP